jgi:hypothetical protein
MARWQSGEGYDMYITCMYDLFDAKSLGHPAYHRNRRGVTFNYFVGVNDNGNNC